MIAHFTKHITHITNSEATLWHIQWVLMQDVCVIYTFLCLYLRLQMHKCDLVSACQPCCLCVCFWMSLVRAVHFSFHIGTWRILPLCMNLWLYNMCLCCLLNTVHHNLYFCLHDDALRSLLCCTGAVFVTVSNAIISFFLKAATINDFIWILFMYLFIYL